MKRIIGIIITIIILSSAAITANAGDWTTGDTARETTWQVLNVVDWRQTRYIAGNPADYNECNPLLGAHPSTGDVDVYFAAIAVTHGVISYLLPPRYRAWWQNGTIGIAAACVGNNINIGIGVRW